MSKKKLTLKDYLSMSNISNFINGTFNKLKDDFELLQPHIKEQALYRAILCKPCYDNGSCLECGCKTPDMFYSVNKTDANGKWGKMLNADAWEIFKQNNHIELDQLDIADLNNVNKAKQVSEQVEKLMNNLRTNTNETEEQVIRND